jgi:hypothetical protein
MDSADRAAPEVAEAKAERLSKKIEKLKQQMTKLKDIEAQLHASPDHQISLTDPDARSTATSGRGSGTVGYNVQTSVDDKHHLIIEEPRLKRWEHETIVETVQIRLEHDPGKMKVRRYKVEHPFGTLKYWMGSTHFLIKTLPRVSTEMSLHVLLCIRPRDVDWDRHSS